MKCIGARYYCKLEMLLLSLLGSYQASGYTFRSDCTRYTSNTELQTFQRIVKKRGSQNESYHDRFGTDSQLHSLNYGVLRGDVV